MNSIADSVANARAQWAPLLQSGQQATTTQMPSVEDLLAQAQANGLSDEAQDVIGRGPDQGADRQQVQARLLQLMQTYGLQPVPPL